MTFIRLDYEDLSGLLSKILLAQSKKEKHEQIKEEVLKEVFS